MNDKRPKKDHSEDWIKGNPEGAYKGIAMFLILLGLISFFVVLKNQPQNYAGNTNTPAMNQLPNKNEENFKDYWAIKGTLGDFTAGIVGTLFSLAGFSLLYLSFKKQTEANVTQLKAYNHDKVEGRFFELLRLHRDNVNELKFTIYHIRDKVENGIYTKVEIPTHFENRHFFVAILAQIKEIFNELDFLFLHISEEKIYFESYLAKVKSNRTLSERNVDRIKYAKIDLLYLIVFYGLSADGQATINSLTKDKYNENFVNKLLATAALKPKSTSQYWNQWVNIQKASNRTIVCEEIINARNGKQKDIEEIYCLIKLSGDTIPVKAFYPNRYEKYYGGHQFRLGHYFRHIYHTISFINDNKELLSKDQYDYVKHLRGQLSTNEQILLFLNSISQLGRIWELEDKKSGKEVDRWKQVMSDYMMIKNIPNDEVLKNVKVSEFYPDIVYEGFDVERKTKALKGA